MGVVVGGGFLLAVLNLVLNLWNLKLSQIFSMIRTVYWMHVDQWCSSIVWLFSIDMKGRVCGWRSIVYSSAAINISECVVLRMVW